MILELIPSDLKTILKKIENLGFTLTLVGGIPRDLIFSKKLGSDFDFEMRANENVSINQWPLYYQKLHQFLEKEKIEFSVLPYLITRFIVGESHCEISSPRIEVNKENDRSHHHFEAVLDSNLTYEESFKRRDFTINAIGLELSVLNDSEKVIDPYLGVVDLEQRVLKNITDDFFFDSVRFLRLIRFSLKFNQFKIDELLMSKIHLFDLSHLSTFHFLAEMSKSQCFQFLNKFSKIVTENKMKIPRFLQVLTEYHFPEYVLSKEEIVGFVFLKNQSDSEKLSSLFALPEKTLKDLKSYYESYCLLNNLKRADIFGMINQSTDDFVKSDFVKNVKNLNDKKIIGEFLHLPQSELLVELLSLKVKKIDVMELNKIEANNRSYYPFALAIKNKFKND